jgi:Tfp pilus assembly protein PilX
MVLPRDERGAALVTTLFFLIIVTLLAAGSLMLSTVQIKVSGSVARWESAFAATERTLKEGFFPSTARSLLSPATHHSRNILLSRSFSANRTTRMTNT